MTPERWERVKEIVYEALDLAPEAREPFLARECGDDEELRREIDSLLETHGHGEAFLETLRSPVVPRDFGDDRAEPRPPRVCPDCNERYEDGRAFCPRDGMPLAEDPAARVGSTLDGLYVIEALVGQGGMGAVYRARHVILGDPVAIKIVRAEFAVHPELIRRFRREGQAARRFKHPNAVTVHDLRTASDGTTYMVLEYVEGATLRAELDAKGQLDPAEAVDLVDQLAGVLDAAHAAGVVHRDVKPDNVMLARDAAGRAVVKLLDLGIAKVAPPRDASALATEITAPGQIMGTPAYMSPEQWGAPQRDGVDEVDARSDVYTLGIVAYEMVAGRRPFSGATIRDFQRDHVARSPVRLDTVAGVSAPFADAVDRALAKDRADRQASAGELAAALRRSLESSAVPTVSRPSVAKPPAGRRSRRAAVVAAALVVAAVIATAVVAMRRSPTPTPVAEAPVPVTPSLSYVVEVERAPRGPVDQTPSAEVRAGQAFKFRFAPSEPGFLYVVFPGIGNVPTTLLTARPIPETGVTTNRVESGAEFEFPRTGDAWLGIRDDAPETRFTVIFSPEPLSEPAFLAGPAGRRLSAAEQTALDGLRAAHPAAPRLDGGRVVVARPTGRPATAPLVFDIPVALAHGP